MKHLLIPCLALASAAYCPAQLTPNQKAFDFTQLATTYAMNYGPIDWKRDAFKVDLLNIGGWLDKVMKSQDDLDFYELCVAYVASLNDAHDAFLLPSDFQAYLGFDVDIYDGKAIVEYIDRSQLRIGRFPFQVGDELVSIDDVPAQDLIAQLSKYTVAANPISTKRFAAWSITYRDQSVMPHAHLIPDTSTVVINRRGVGPQSFSIPWDKTGTPLTIVGPVVPPFSSSTANRTASTKGNSAPATPDYMRPLNRLRNMHLPLRRNRAVLGFGETAPVFQLPSNFVKRMGTGVFDFFYTGTFAAQNLKIGYIRIPSFDSFLPSGDFQKEIDYMQQNTDGLVVDIMRNPGGNPCAAEDLLQRLIPTPFRNIGLEIRATRGWWLAFSQALQDAKDFGAPDSVVSEYQALFDAVDKAFRTPSGRTPALPVCDPTLDVQPAADKSGKVIAYDKPVMLLVDEMSASAADYFAAVFQDNQRGPLFGMRTMGAGGNVDAFPATTYSEGYAYVTESLMRRKDPVATPEYPTAPYVENIGVRPEVVQDYMTVDNLVNRGAAFVQAFTDAMVRYLQSGSPREQDPSGAAAR